MLSPRVPRRSAFLCGRVQFDLSLIQLQGFVRQEKVSQHTRVIEQLFSKVQAADASCGMFRPSACVREKANTPCRSSCSRSCRSWKTNKVFVNDRSAALHSVAKPLCLSLSFARTPVIHIVRNCNVRAIQGASAKRLHRTC